LHSIRLRLIFTCRPSGGIRLLECYSGLQMNAVQMNRPTTRDYTRLYRTSCDGKPL
jgi:hypothetical protein